jgi:hypothetical protein
LRRDGRTIHWRSQDGNSGTAVITVPAPIQAAAVPPRAQIETKKIETKIRIAAPEPQPTPANAFVAAQPRETPVAAAQPLEPAVVEAVAEAPSVDAAVAQAPGTLAERSPQPRPAPMSPLYVVTNVDRDDVLNVRDGPSTEFAVVGELQPGSRDVSITGACRSEWCPVRHQATSGWVNRMYLAPASQRTASIEDLLAADKLQDHSALRDPPQAPRTCLTPPARALLERIEEKFGPVKLLSTCRPGATIAGSGRQSRHASGNAVDFDADSRKRDIVDWLIANHQNGGTMTYSGMAHIHIDIGPHFVSIAGGRHWASWRDEAQDFPGRMARTSSNN